MRRLLRPQLIWPIVSGLLLAALLLQAFPWLAGTLHPSLSEPTERVAEVRASAPLQLPRQQGPVSYAEAVRLAAPAVVNIYSTVRIEQPLHPLFNDPFLQRFYGPDHIPRQQRMQSSLGSGVLVSSEGYILTNHHVIQNASEIRVALQDGREAFARIIGSDPDSDLAVVKIDLDALPAINLASSDTLQVGDVVLAIGNPFGVGQTVTQGIVSALGRNSLGINTYEDFIQTDAAINPGNSGGALINPFGQLLGINTAIFSRTGGSQGIGFAIPSQQAQQIMLDLINEGYVVRGWLGMDLQETHRGLIINGLLRNGPAHQAGALPGDHLRQLNGEAVRSARQVINDLARLRPGTRVTLGLERDGDSFSVEAEVGQRPASAPAHAN